MTTLYNNEILQWLDRILKSFVTEPSKLYAIVGELLTDNVQLKRQVQWLTTQLKLSQNMPKPRSQQFSFEELSHLRSSGTNNTNAGSQVYSKGWCDQMNQNDMTTLSYSPPKYQSSSSSPCMHKEDIDYVCETEQPPPPKIKVPFNCMNAPRKRDSTSFSVEREDPAPVFAFTHTLPLPEEKAIPRFNIPSQPQTIDRATRRLSLTSPKEEEYLRMNCFPRNPVDQMEQPHRCVRRENNAWFESKRNSLPNPEEAHEALRSLRWWENQPISPAVGSSRIGDSAISLGSESSLYTEGYSHCSEKLLNTLKPSPQSLSQRRSSEPYRLLNSPLLGPCLSPFFYPGGYARK